MRIYDVFTFCDETEILARRLDELRDIVDVFVAVEGNRTHQGKLRGRTITHQGKLRATGSDIYPLVYPPVRSVYVDLPLEPGPPPPTSAFCPGDHWERFRLQQEAGWLGICDAMPEDIILFGDVDEIPFAATVESIRKDPPEPGVIGVIPMEMYIYSDDWVSAEPWVGTGVARIDTAREKTLHRIRVDRPGALSCATRNQGHIAGQHLSWFGGPEAIRRKLRSFTHPELADFAPAVEWAIKHGISPNGEKLTRVE